MERMGALVNLRCPAGQQQAHSDEHSFGVMVGFRGTACLEGVKFGL